LFGLYPPVTDGTISASSPFTSRTRSFLLKFSSGAPIHLTITSINKIMKPLHHQVYKWCTLVFSMVQAIIFGGGCPNHEFASLLSNCPIECSCYFTPHNNSQRTTRRTPTTLYNCTNRADFRRLLLDKAKGKRVSIEQQRRNEEETKKRNFPEICFPLRSSL